MEYGTGFDYRKNFISTKCITRCTIGKSLFSAVRLQFQVNEVLNVADLAAITLTQGTATTDAGLTSTQTAITTIVNKLNEILQKPTISNC